MKAVLLENRVGHSLNHSKTIKAGTIVKVVGQDENSGRILAKKGIYDLNFTQDQAQPIDE